MNKEKTANSLPRGSVLQKPDRAKDFGGTVMHLAQYLKPYQVTVTAVVIFACGSSVFSIVGPKLLGKATTKLYEGLIAWALGTGLLTDFSYIKKIMLILLILYVSSALLSYLQSYLMAHVSMNVTYQLRKDISEKMNRLPLNYYDTRSHGEILSRITNDVDTVSLTLNQSLTQIITAVTTLGGIIVMMLSISLRLTLIAAAILPVSMGLITLIIKNSQKFFHEQQTSLGRLNGHIEETYGGHQVVQVFNGEQEAIAKFCNINDDLYDSAWKSQFLSGMMMPIMSFVSNFGYVCVCLAGGYLAVKNVIEIGDVQAFIQYMRSFMQPISQIANVANTLQSTAAAAERVFEFLSESEEVKETEHPIRPDRITGIVEFKNVKFGYRPETIIIHDFSAKIKAGQTVAIVGPTGAGKTTIVKLLMRFYELNSGQILVDGYDSVDFSREALRSLFGMVLQETWLYNATVMDNIRYGNFDKTDDEVIDAARAAHCDEFIRIMPGGYQMMINEESSNLSQGQKQLLTIARTILADPKILILDEATSSIDTRTEVLVQKAMGQLMQNRTSFVIAHRLSTIRDADVILVMKEGDIIEQGNHNTLLEQKGFYYELYRSQFAE